VGLDTGRRVGIEPVQQAFDALAVLGPPRERFGRNAPSPSDKGGQL
jgi:hypothetical protein